MRTLAGRDDGLTMIELLIVMVIVAMLAAISIPAFLTQRAMAHDTSTKSDVTNVGKEIATYYVDGQGPVTLDMAAVPGSMVISDGSWTGTVNLTNGTAFPTSGKWANLGDPTGWCISLTDPKGAVGEYNYSASDGLEAGTC